MKDKLFTKLSKLLHKIGVEDAKIEEIVNDLKDDKDEVVDEDVKEDEEIKIDEEPKKDDVKEDEKIVEDKPSLDNVDKPEEPIEEPKDDLKQEQEEITEEKKNDIVDAHQGEEIVTLKEEVNGVKTKMEEYGEKLTALYNALKEAGIIEKEKKDIGLPGKATSMVEEETTADLLKKMNSRF
jgi:hypothetical protein